MKLKPLSLFTVLLLTIPIFGAATAQDRTVSKALPGQGSKPDAKGTKVSTDKIQQDVAEALAIIEQNHTIGKKIDYNDVFKSTIAGALHTLDPHSNYFDAKEFEQFKTEQSSRYYGIGATIGDLSDSDGKVLATYIRATFDGAPAHKAGLRYGDKIVEVNGTSVLGKSYPDVRNLLRGPRGTNAKLVVERHATGKRETIDIVRDAVPQPSIGEAYMIRPGIGYIGMTGGFNQTTYREFIEAMRKLKGQGMTQLVLDLKDNGGGLVSQASGVANSFLSTGQMIFTQKGRIEGVTEPHRAENPRPETMPVVVLVNSNSASASEILAGALQDHDRALIVGEQTFGKGLVTYPFPLDFGSMLLLTVAKYETPSGRQVQRDYSHGNLYDYYTGGGVGREADTNPEGPSGSESKTDLGRSVYGGGGIQPDVVVKANTIPIEQARQQSKLNVPVFAFALDLAYGKVPGFESYKVDKPIQFGYDLNTKDFVVSDPLYQAFKAYAVTKYKYTPAQVDKFRPFVERSLRAELVTAAYGTTTSFQVYKELDNQLTKAIESLPQAKALAIEGAKAKVRASSAKQTNP